MLFGKVDEGARRELFSTGMVPPNQSLEAHDGALGEVEDRLVHQCKLFVANGV